MRLTLYLFLGLLLSMPIALSSDASFFNDKSKDLSYFVNDINSYEIQYSFKGFSVSSNVNLDNNPQEINNNQELENRGNRSIDLPFSWIISLIFICLLIGFFLGNWWADYRNRRRHGGIRI